MCAPLLGPSKSLLGALLGRSRVLLGPPWGPLGPLLGALSGNIGAIVRPQKLIGGEKARRQTSLISFSALEGFCLLGGPEGAPTALGAVVERLVGPLGACRKLS